MKTVTIETTKRDEVVDITETVETQLQEVQAASGICVVFAAHTTCALTTADLDPGTDQDFLDVLRKLLPGMSYRHPHDPAHAPDHLLSSIIGPSVAIPYSNYQLALGIWQRVIL